eukprot:COSAG02_NODE_3711_length_6341_cov_4.360622_7_plen_240_part_00
MCGVLTIIMRCWFGAVASKANRFKAKAMVVAVAAVVRVDTLKEDAENGHVLEVLEVLCNCCRKGHTGFQDYIATQTNHEDKHDLISDIVLYVNHIERDMKTVVQETGEGDASVAKARNHLTLKRARSAFKLLQSLASGPHYGNQLAIVHTDIVSVVNRILAVSTLKVRRRQKIGKKKLDEVEIYQQGRDGADIYHDLGARDEAVAPCRLVQVASYQANAATISDARCALPLPTGTSTDL